MSCDITRAQFVDEPVVKDGKLITAMGPAFSFDFGFALLKELKGEQAAQTVKKDMLYGR
jgi:putative intracellular protease/amidase